jgi:hypothetical protein
MAAAVRSGRLDRGDEAHVDEDDISLLGQCDECRAADDELLDSREEEALAVHEADLKGLKGPPIGELVDVGFPHRPSIRAQV